VRHGHCCWSYWGRFRDSYALLDFVTENYQPVSEAIHAEIDELERNVLCSSLNEHDIQNLHGLRRDVLRLRRYVAPMVEISEELQKLSFHSSTRTCARIS